MTKTSRTVLAIAFTLVLLSTSLIVPAIAQEPPQLPSAAEMLNDLIGRDHSMDPGVADIHYGSDPPMEGVDSRLIDVGINENLGEYVLSRDNNSGDYLITFRGNDGDIVEGWGQIAGFETHHETVLWFFDTVHIDNQSWMGMTSVMEPQGSGMGHPNQMAQFFDVAWREMYGTEPPLVSYQHGAIGDTYTPGMPNSADLTAWITVRIPQQTIDPTITTTWIDRIRNGDPDHPDGPNGPDGDDPDGPDGDDPDSPDDPDGPDDDDGDDSGPLPPEWNPPTGVNDCPDFPILFKPPYPLVIGQDTQDPPRGVDVIVDLTVPPCPYQKWDCVEWEYYEAYSVQKDEWVTKKRCIREGWVWTAAEDPLKRVKVVGALSEQSVYDIEQGYIQHKYPGARVYQHAWTIYNGSGENQGKFWVDYWGPGEGNPPRWEFQGSYEKAKVGKGVGFKDPGTYNFTIWASTQGIDPSHCHAETRYCERCIPGQTYVWHCSDALKVWMAMGSLISGQ